MVNVHELEYWRMPIFQSCGESSFGLANHHGCGSRTDMVLVLPGYVKGNPRLAEGIIAFDTNVYVFCCKECLDQYKQIQ